MISIKDDKGFNQGFKPSRALDVRTERRCDFMIKQMKIREETNILEIGCGTGEISFLLARKTKAHIFGTDICAPFINEAKNRYSGENLKFEILDFNNSKNIQDTMQGKKFDYIVGNGILHHLYNQLDEALENLNLLLKNGGQLIFLEPNIINPYCFLIFKFPFFRRIANLEPEEMAFSKKFIEKKLSLTGFKSIRVEYRDFLLPITPIFLIKPSIVAGDLIEKIPLINELSQSIFIVAKKISK